MSIPPPQRFFVGSIGIVLTINIPLPSGYTLNGMTATLTWTLADGIEQTRSGVITDPVGGVVQYAMVSGDLPSPGTLRGRVTFTGGGDVVPSTWFEETVEQ